MRSEPVVRPATASDAEAFLSLVDALADYEKLERPAPDARERLLRDGFGDRSAFRPYLAELHGEPVGYAITFLTYSSFLARPTLYLEDIFVLPEARSRGVGKALFRLAAAEAVERGCGRMEWAVLDWNQLAIDFYERMGARRMAEWYTYRLAGEQIGAVARGEGA
jgi:GNAT superfamily N-acetyltransferase